MAKKPQSPNQAPPQAQAQVPFAQAVLPPQIHAQAGMIVDRLFQNMGLALIDPSHREVAVRTVGLAVVSAFQSGVEFQKQMNPPQAPPTPATPSEL